MDTSAQYVKMRLAAISDLGKGNVPDRGPYCEMRQSTVSIKGEDHVIIMDSTGDYYCMNCKYTLGQGIYSQLERQDQLQEMLEFFRFFTGTPVLQIGAMYHRTTSEGDPDGYYFFNFRTMEQILLAFLMKEKYQKSWNGEDWING